MAITTNTSGQITTTNRQESSIMTSTDYEPQGLVNLGLQGVKTVLDFVAPDINYQKLKLQAGYKQNQADNIDLKAQEQANYIRGQFAGAVGSYKTNTAQRNVKVGEGSAGMNVESSARDLGFDISKMKDNASFQSGILRSQADMYNQAAKDQKGINEWDKIAGLFDNIGKMAGIYGIMEETKTVTETKTTTPPKKPVVPEKPIVKNKDKKTITPETEKAIEKAPEVSETKVSMKDYNVNQYDSPATDIYFSKKHGAFDQSKLKLMPKEVRFELAREMIKDGRGLPRTAKLFGLTDSEVAELAGKKDKGVV